MSVMSVSHLHQNHLEGEVACCFQDITLESLEVEGRNMHF